MLNFALISRRKKPIVIAHRGASNMARENTLEAFEAAISVGADAVEFDVRRTGDGILIIHHDKSISGSAGAISDSTFRRIQSLADAQSYAVPTLEETLRMCSGRIALDIELKEEGYEEEVLSLVGRYYDLAHVVFKSFKGGAICKIKDLDSEVITGLVFGLPSWVSPFAGLRKIFPVSAARRCRADFISPHWKLLKSLYFRRMRSAGLPLFVWTVDDVHLAQQLIEYGVAAIITNVPEKILPLIKEPS